MEKKRDTSRWWDTGDDQMGKKLKFLGVEK
jgi:hypothetical protein